MKIIKYLLFLILIAFIAGSIYIATKDGRFSAEESYIIKAPAPLLFREVADLSNWQTWPAWNDNEMELTYLDNTTGEGAGFTWTSEEMRDGKITTTGISPYNQIEQDLEIETSTGKASARVVWEFEQEENETRVTWRMTGSQNFKQKLAFTLQNTNMPEIFEPIFEKSLKNLETEITRKMEEYTVNVQGTTRHGGGYYMYRSTAAKINEVNQRAAELFEDVTNYMKENGISINGKPFIIYNQRDEQNGTTIFSAALPTASQVVTPSGSRVLNGYLPAQKVVKTTLKGNYKNAAEAWEASYRYIEENELEVDSRGKPFEVYITNPVEQENPALWITEIYIPVVESSL